MIEVTVDTTKVVAKLEHIANVGEAMKPAIVRAADRVRSEVSEYAPSSAANTPTPGKTYYQRGYGSIYVRKAATVKQKGRGFVISKGGRGSKRKTSEMMNRKWSTVYRFTEAEAEAVIGNSASYAPYVHDSRKQARFHAARGWRTAQGTIEKLRDRIRGDFEQAVKQWLAKG